MTASPALVALVSCARTHATPSQDDEVVFGKSLHERIFLSSCFGNSDPPSFKVIFPLPKLNSEKVACHAGKKHEDNRKNRESAFPE